jgi:predicted phage gp36 major capsid-like protein
MLFHIYALLAERVLPDLKGIQASQAEQRVQTEFLDRTLEEFRADMQLRFAELRADLAACRAQLEDAVVTLRESESANADDPASTRPAKKNLLN